MHVANANDDNDDAVASDDNNAHTKYKQIKQQQTSSYISKEKKNGKNIGRMFKGDREWQTNK